MATNGGGRCQRGSIRRRGNSFQVMVYAWLDPLTGRRMYLTASTTDEVEVQRILTRLQAEVDVQRRRLVRTVSIRASTCATWRPWSAVTVLPSRG